MNERDIFLAALEQPTAEARSEYLSLACAGDLPLQQRVEGLLQMHERTGEFLQKPLVERLVEGVAALEDAADTAGDPSASGRGRNGLEFLSPSKQPGSLGRLGHYEVQEVIGSGGMGIVLRAFDERLHRVVAIKVMAAPLATSAAARKRFQREARAAAAVCHDHIVTIHAVEESDDVPYLVMQCVSGLSLQERIDRDGPLELHEILRIGMQTAAGLAAAHAQGLIHRDIKPANILLENGVERVKITDFGLARAAADASISQSGAIIGTPQYMAPEQARGEALDGRTDLFSLGSVLYAMCTGRAPFRAASSIAVLKRVCEEAPGPIREANADIPDWLVVLIDKLHAKNPDDRYQSAAEVAELLGQRLAQLQISTALPPAVLLASGSHLASGGRKPPDSSVPAGGFLARKRRWAFAVAAVLILAATLGLAEGTGATKFTATVIRLLTPEGTLVVEMTDPDVKVTIDGDGSLVVTGVGQHVVRLKLGKHTLQADKDGKPVPLDQELVTITRGDKPVVRVRLEGAAAPSVAAPKTKLAAFVLLDGQRVEMRKFDTLAEAVQRASDGDTIEIHGNGPFVSDPILIQGKSLTIRAGANFRPVFQLSSNITTDSPLALEGLELQRLDEKVPVPEPSEAALICSRRESSPLYIANCRFREHLAVPCVFTRAKSYMVLNCEFLSLHMSSVTTSYPPGKGRVIDNCLGYRAGRDGKDLGTDVDLVGPGPAYERWKKTPDYQDWLQDTKAAIDGAIAARAPKIDYVRQAIEHAAAGRLDQAAEDFSRALNVLADPSPYATERLRIVDQFTSSDELFERVVKLRPEDINLWSHRAHHLAQVGRWEAAIACYQKRLDLGPDGAGFWQMYSLALLAKNDERAYRSLCEEILTEYANNSNPHEAAHAALAMAIVPDAVKDKQRAFSLAERAVNGDPDKAWWISLTYAAWLYRLDRLDEAITWLDKGKEGDYQGFSLCFLAMAHHRLGHADEARRYADAARQKKSAWTKSTNWAFRVRVERLIVEMDSVLAAEPDKAEK